MGLRRGRPVGKGGLAGAGVRRRICHRAGIELGFGDAWLIFLLDRGRACLRVDGCGLLPGEPGGGIDGDKGDKEGG
jgi:hypothetical protein